MSEEGKPVDWDALDPDRPVHASQASAHGSSNGPAGVSAGPGFTGLFRTLTGHAPFPYQERLARGRWPEVIDVPTGLGKTAAVIVAWLDRLLRRDGGAGTRLVYCLPMRVLVDQTRAVAERLCAAAAGAFQSCGLPLPTVHSLLGGYVDETWELHPERPAILVGTQDMLLSRALDRGYAMSRFKWPVHFGLLHLDATWVLDETQLMGVAVESSAQLEGLRKTLGTLGHTHTIWMSATLGRGQLDTVDHPVPQDGWRILSLDEQDRAHELVRKRTGARKPLQVAPARLGPKNEDAYVQAVAERVAEAHETRGGLTLVIVNRVARAQAVFGALHDRGIEPLGLVHSRFRGSDRARQESLLEGDSSRVVVATQAIEAGVDVSARTLFTELAPWPSLVQRFGRCNRYGEQEAALVEWLDLEVETDRGLALPYEVVELEQARAILGQLDDVGAARLGGVSYTPLPVVRPVLRRRDLLDLFDTSPDLLGNDIDVSRFVRDGEDTDVRIYYRLLDGEPNEETTAPSREELVAVSLGAARAVLDRLAKKRDGEKDRERKRWLRAWAWNPLGKPSVWSSATSVHPGQVLLLDARAGGYDEVFGWTGDVLPKRAVPVVSTEGKTPSAHELMDADPRSALDRWITLPRHLDDVAREAETLAVALGLPDRLREAVIIAARWHDVGKAHVEFQRRMVEPVREDPSRAPPGEGPWAKSNHHERPPKGSRPYFRHELASTLAWLQSGPREQLRDLVAYLIAAHHGKVRLSIRSVPGERQPTSGALFARGVWHGDVLPAVDLGDGTRTTEVELDLSPMQLGEGSWLERTLALRDDPELGPFRLAGLEAIVRIADWRASQKERDGE